jgi:molybdopterin-guanine dinucleotide biosynthesis protein A
MVTKQNVTGLILAGGGGRRVGGDDKGLLNYNGISLIERQIQWLKPQVKTVLISANRNIEQYKRYHYEVLQDNQQGFEGPLHGVLKGLEFCSTQWLFIQPVDMPNLPSNLIELIQTKSVVADCYYLKSNQREHYLSMLISRKCLPVLRNYLNSGNRRVSHFHQHIESVVLDIGLHESLFKNLNFQSDYQ